MEAEMKRQAATALLMVVSFGPLAFAADRTWTGKIGDSKCGASHKSAQEHNASLTDRACTEACVKSGGEYILSSNGKVYKLKVWRESEPEAPAGLWFKDFGSFKICGEGALPKTFLLKGQPAKGEAL